MEEENSSKLIDYLPNLFREKTRDGTPPFIERYLRIFEQILIETDENGLPGENKTQVKKGIAETLTVMSELFYPGSGFFNSKDISEQKTGENDRESRKFADYFSIDMDGFLRWLADWIALVLKEDWDRDKRREVIARMIPIYRKRGTKAGLEEYLKIYAGEGVSITDELGPFQLEVNSRVEKDTVIEGLPPYCFIVNMILTVPDPALLYKKKKAVTDIIETEKPVHTNYVLNITVPTMQIEVCSTVEVDTLIGV